jgi:hypothetical protein
MRVSDVPLSATVEVELLPSSLRDFLKPFLVRIRTTKLKYLNEMLRMRILLVISCIALLATLLGMRVIDEIFSLS